MTPDPNGAHTLPIDNDVCPRCHGELSHPDEMKMQLCYGCSAKERKWFDANGDFIGDKTDHREPR